MKAEKDYLGKRGHIVVIDLKKGDNISPELLNRWGSHLLAQRVISRLNEKAAAKQPPKEKSE